MRWNAGIRRGVRTFSRERRSMTTVASLAGLMLLGQLLFLMSIGAQGFDSLVRTESALQVPLQSGASDRQIQEFFAAVRQLPSVASVEYIPREKAIELGGAANPFIDVISVRFKDFWSSQGFSSFLRQASWGTVIDSASLSLIAEQQREIYNQVILASTARAVGWTLFFITCAVLIAAIAELVRRRALQRRDEIFVERMAGADDEAILLPFATEATVLLVGALLLGLLCTAMILLALPTIFSTFTATLWWTETGRLILASAPIALAIAVIFMPFLAWAGSILGLRRI